MKSFMEMFENIMVGVAFAEEGISVLLFRQTDTPHKELEEEAWDII